MGTTNPPLNMIFHSKPRWQSDFVNIYFCLFHIVFFYRGEEDSHLSPMPPKGIIPHEFSSRETSARVNDWRPCDDFLEFQVSLGQRCRLLLRPLSWWIPPPALRAITPICAFQYARSWWFTHLRRGEVGEANFGTSRDKRWYLSEPAAWDGVTAKVAPNGVCGAVGAHKSVSSA